MLVERLERRPQGVVVVGERPLASVRRRRAPRVGERPVVLADPLDEPDGRRVPVSASTRLYFSDEEPALTTRTEVAHAGRHRLDVCAWMAVIATVLTMSRTVAPRERSLTGLRRPCRTGPTATAPAERCTAL